ncbi:MAG: glycosyltransferase [Candidatus Nanopelagicales bacterium]|nr:glycosyltransferase [Candidatus Nanopelagicales bacterium]
MHVVYLALFFPPSRASGAHRPRAFANVLADRGWRVSVVTAPIDYLVNASSGIDELSQDTVRPEVAIHRPEFDTGVWATDLRRMSWTHRRFPELWSKARQKLVWKTTGERYSAWVPTAFREILKIHRRSPVDVILATGNPFSGFIAARMAAEVIRRPYVIDYRDPWTFNSFTERDNFAPRSMPMRAERWAIHGAARVLHVNEGLRDEYSRRYPESADRMTVVRNGWDPEFLADLNHDAPTRDGVLSFRFLGTLTDAMPLESLFGGWSAATEGSAAAAGWTLDLYGHLGFTPTQRRVVDEAMSGSGRQVQYHGPVPRPLIGKVYADADVLVFAVGGGRFVTGGKVYEYMATGLPIVSIHDPNLAAAEELRQYPLWFPAASQAASDVADAFRRAANARTSLTSEMRRRAAAVASRYTRESAILPFEVDLREIARGRG